MNQFKMNSGLFFDADKDGAGGGADDKKVVKDPTEGMSNAELKAFATDMVEKKQSANEEAKTMRLENDALKKEKTDEAAKLADADKTLTDKLSESTSEITALKSQIANNEARTKATSKLIGDGYPSNLVELAVEGVTVENADAKIKDFTTKFKKPEAEKPGNTQFSHPRTVITSGPERGPTSKAGQAIADMRKQNT